MPKMKLILLISLIAAARGFPERTSNLNNYNLISPLNHQNLHQRFSSAEEIDDSETPNVSKHIYYHTAPEEPEEEPRKVFTSKPQKNYRVVFIRAPVYKPAKLSIVNPTDNEEKTVIYVLSKKAEVADLDIATPAPIKEPSKPEVYFIKYKTQQEALNAQQQIQAHYDALGGETKHNDEEIAPIQSVVGLLNNDNALFTDSEDLEDNNDYIQPTKSLSVLNTSNSSPYLPPQKKF